MYSHTIPLLKTCYSCKHEHENVEVFVNQDKKTNKDFPFFIECPLTTKRILTKILYAFYMEGN